MRTDKEIRLSFYAFRANDASKVKSFLLMNSTKYMDM